MGSILDQAQAIRASMDNVSADIPDSLAAENKYIFALWSPDSAAYTVVARVRYGDQLYKCLTAHTSQAGWTPADAPGLWVRIDDPAVEWPEWRQPAGRPMPIRQALRYLITADTGSAAQTPTCGSRGCPDGRRRFLRYISKSFCQKS